MAPKDATVHSCERCQKLVIDFRGENIEEFYARHARLKAQNPTPGPAPRPSTMTEGRMKNNMFKFGVTRSEIRQSAVEGCPLCRFIIECKNPDDCENEDDLAL
jgi:hypothetical protein